jgi:hypothetical protein
MEDLFLVVCLGAPNTKVVSPGFSSFAIIDTALTGWNAWFHNANGILNPSFDTFPDTTDLAQNEIFPTPQLALADGKPAVLFSSRHPHTIARYVAFVPIPSVVLTIDT